MSKGRILVVEDELIVARDIQVTLQSFGYDVPEIVMSGEEAVQAAYRLRPDLIMMDIMIQGAMDGVESAEIIRSQFNIPVIYLTAYSDEETLRRAKLTESYGFIAKPFDERELYVAVEFALYKFQLNSRVMESKNWLEAILRSFPEPLIAIDHDERIAFLSSKAEGLIGQQEIEIKGRWLGEVFQLSGTLNEESGESILTHRSPLGTEQSFVARLNPIYSENGLSMGKLIVLGTKDR